MPYSPYFILFICTYPLYSSLQLHLFIVFDFVFLYIAKSLLFTVHFKSLLFTVYSKSFIVYCLF